MNHIMKKKIKKKIVLIQILLIHLIQVNHKMKTNQSNLKQKKWIMINKELYII